MKQEKLGLGLKVGLLNWVNGSLRLLEDGTLGRCHRSTMQQLGKRFARRVQREMLHLLADFINANFIGQMRGAPL